MRPYSARGSAADNRDASVLRAPLDSAPQLGQGGTLAPFTQRRGSNPAISLRAISLFNSWDRARGNVEKLAMSIGHGLLRNVYSPLDQVHGQ